MNESSKVLRTKLSILQKFGGPLKRIRDQRHSYYKTQNKSCSLFHFRSANKPFLPFVQERDSMGRIYTRSRETKSLTQHSYIDPGERKKMNESMNTGTHSRNHSIDEQKTLRSIEYTKNLYKQLNFNKFKRKKSKYTVMNRQYKAKICVNSNINQLLKSKLLPRHIQYIISNKKQNQTMTSSFKNTQRLPVGYKKNPSISPDYYQPQYSQTKKQSPILSFYANSPRKDSKRQYPQTRIKIQLQKAYDTVHSSNIASPNIHKMCGRGMFVKKPDISVYLKKLKESEIKKEKQLKYEKPRNKNKKDKTKTKNHISEYKKYSLNMVKNPRKLNSINHVVISRKRIFQKFGIKMKK